MPQKRLLFIVVPLVAVLTLVLAIMFRPVEPTITYIPQNHSESRVSGMLDRKSVV